MPSQPGSRILTPSDRSAGSLDDDHAVANAAIAGSGEEGQYNPQVAAPAATPGARRRLAHLGARVNAAACLMAEFAPLLRQ